MQTIKQIRLDLSVDQSEIREQENCFSAFYDAAESTPPLDAMAELERQMFLGAFGITAEDQGTLKKRQFVVAGCGPGREVEWLIGGDAQVIAVDIAG